MELLRHLSGVSAENPKHALACLKQLDTVPVAREALFEAFGQLWLCLIKEWRQGDFIHPDDAIQLVYDKFSEWTEKPAWATYIREVFCLCLFLIRCVPCECMRSQWTVGSVATAACVLQRSVQVQKRRAS
jgi:hypothetical protein